jgi:hypothetical protein
MVRWPRIRPIRCYRPIRVLDGFSSLHREPMNVPNFPKNPFRPDSTKAILLLTYLIPLGTVFSR